MTWIRDGEVPIYSAHGTTDSVVPYGTDFAYALGFPIIVVAGSGSIEAHVDSLGIYNYIYTIPGEDHMAHDAPSHRPTTVSTMVNFLNPLVCTTVGQTNISADTKIGKSVLNPATDWLQIDLPTNAGAYSLQLVERTGKIWQTDKGSDTSVRLNISQLPAGMYLLHLQTANQAASWKKVVVR